MNRTRIQPARGAKRVNSTLREKDTAVAGVVAGEEKSKSVDARASEPTLHCPAPARSKRRSLPPTNAPTRDDTHSSTCVPRINIFSGQEAPTPVPVPYARAVAGGHAFADVDNAWYNNEDDDATSTIETPERQTTPAPVHELTLTTSERALTSSERALTSSERALTSDRVLTAAVMTQNIATVIRQRVEEELSGSPRAATPYNIYTQQRKSVEARHAHALRLIEANAARLSPEAQQREREAEERGYQRRLAALAHAEARDAECKPPVPVLHLPKVCAWLPFRNASASTSTTEARALVTERVRREVTEEFLCDAKNTAIQLAADRKMRRLAANEHFLAGIKRARTPDTASPTNAPFTPSPSVVRRAF